MGHPQEQNTTALAAAMVSCCDVINGASLMQSLGHPPTPIRVPRSIHWRLINRRQSWFTKWATSIQIVAWFPTSAVNTRIGTSSVSVKQRCPVGKC